MTKKKTFSVIQYKDSFGEICHIAEYRFKGLPNPLSWIEPSINMLYLECVSSYIFCNDFCSIISMSALLEHTLRLALLDKQNTGLNRELSQTKINKINSISSAIKMASDENLIGKQDKLWWDNIAKVIRNKSAHYLIPRLIKEFSKCNYDQACEDRENYIPSYYSITNNDGLPQNIFSHDWGMFFHKVGYFIAKQFIIDGTNHLKKIIKKTQWKPDRSYWANQERIYNDFFSYNWNVVEMKKSLNDTF